jgi:Tol biopolymer transport system component
VQIKYYKTLKEKLMKINTSSQAFLYLLGMTILVLSSLVSIFNHTKASESPLFISGKMAYILSVPGNNKVMIRNGDGSNPIVVHSSGIGLLGSPSFSPNGKKLVFSSDEQSGGSADIFVINIDGTGMTNITNNANRDETPSWSPDGTKIAFISTRDSGSQGEYDLFVMNADGTNPVNISNAASTLDRFPSWSPDSSKIYYSSARGGPEQVYAYDVGLSTEVKVTNFSSTAYEPKISPDGMTVLYSGVGAGDTKVQLYTQNIDGTNVKKPYQLCSTSDSQWPSWSPDGKKILFTSGCETTTIGNLYFVNADGTGLKRITSSDTEYVWGSTDWQRLPINKEVDDLATGKKKYDVSDDRQDTDYEVQENEDLSVDGKTGDVIVHGKGTLKGHGSVGKIEIESEGHLAPGNSPGCIATSDLSLASGSALDAELGGTTACSGYDQTDVTGTVTITDATLNAILFGGFVPSVGNSFTIVNNDGSDAVSGTFNGLAEGSTFTSGGVTYRISYVGGTGNDVVLTVTAVSSTLTPTAPNTGFELLKANPLKFILINGIIALGLFGIARYFSKKTI